MDKLMRESIENQSWKTLGVNCKSLLLESECSVPSGSSENPSFHLDMWQLSILFNQSY